MGHIRIGGVHALSPRCGRRGFSDETEPVSTDGPSELDGDATEAADFEDEVDAAEKDAAGQNAIKPRKKQLRKTRNALTSRPRNRRRMLTMPQQRKWKWLKTPNLMPIAVLMTVASPQQGRAMGSRTISGLLIVLALSVPACTTDAIQTDTTDAIQTDKGPSGEPPPEAESTTTTIAADPEPTEVIQHAVDEVLNAGSYAFKVTVGLAVNGEMTETELEGWVDGSDRELTMKAGENQVTTRVIDGLATIERDGDVTEVPLREVGDSPSLDILNELTQVSFASATEITGTLNASALKASGFDINGAAKVIVTLTEDGSLAGYTITGNNNNWTVAAQFFDIGQSFTE